MRQSQENLQTGIRTGGQTLFYGTLPAEDGGPTNSTSRDTCEDFQNLPAIKVCSVSFNYDAELPHNKNKGKRSGHSGGILRKRTKQSDLQKEFWAKNSRKR